MAIEFSVIVPIYNMEPWLRQCVDSILAQTFGAFELILVDDGSTDGSGAICDAYAARDGRVRVLRQQNSGPTPARRNGLDHASGEYVCFVDGDDWVERDWLQVLHGHILAHDRPDMILFDHRRDTSRRTEPILAEEGYYGKARLERDIYPRMLWDPRRKPVTSLLFPGYLCTKAFRRELIAAHFVSDDRIQICEDLAMCFECLYWARDAYISLEKLYVYRYRPQSSLHRPRPDYLRQMWYLSDYLFRRLGGREAYLDRQLNAVCMMRLLTGLFHEYNVCRDLREAAKRVGALFDETGFGKLLSFSGLPPRMGALLLLLKCRCYRLVMLLIKLRA